METVNENNEEEKKQSSQSQSQSQSQSHSEPPNSFIHFSKSPALQFEVWSECRISKARRSRLILPHGEVNTPVFMPVGTQGTMKGLLTSEMCSDIECEIMLSNTYHLALRPTTKIIKSLGGIHKFMGMNNSKCNILTDSGGFQMVSLLELASFSEDGVQFQSPVDGTEMLLTPEKCMELQNEIGSDIMMALDDVVPVTFSNNQRFKESTYRTIRWLGRCIKSHQNENKQNLFGIIQGGLDLNLRKICLTEIINKYNSKLPGYAIGGLSGGESKDEFWKIVLFCTNLLPLNKPRYVMGVGYPLDLIVCIALGADMFDCVYPARTARFGTALYIHGELKLNQKKYKYDFNVIDKNCKCSTCKSNYTRSYLHSIIGKKNSNSPQLITNHNIYYLLNLMKNVRKSIRNQKFPQFVREFMKSLFPNGGIKSYPKWAVDAFNAVGIKFDY